MIKDFNENKKYWVNFENKFCKDYFLKEFLDETNGIYYYVLCDENKEYDLMDCIDVSCHEVFETKDECIDNIIGNLCHKMQKLLNNKVKKMIKKNFKVQPFDMCWFFSNKEIKRGRLMDDDFWKDVIDEESLVTIAETSANYRVKIKDLFLDFNECVIEEIKKVEAQLDYLRKLLNNG